jgi:hypothetical protein
MADIYHLHGILSAIDDDIKRLLIKRNEIVRKIDTIEECLAMRARAILFVGIIDSIASINDPVLSLAHRNNRLEPWKHNLPRNYFANVHEVWDTPSSIWTCAEASQFFQNLSLAVGHDVASLENIMAGM